MESCNMPKTNFCRGQRPLLSSFCVLSSLIIKNHENIFLLLLLVLQNCFHTLSSVIFNHAQLHSSYISLTVFFAFLLHSFTLLLHFSYIPLAFFLYSSHIPLALP